MSLHLKNCLIIISLVVAASGCIHQPSNNSLKSIDYTPPEGFEKSLTYLPLVELDKFSHRDPSKSQIYENENKDYVYAGRVNFSSEIDDFAPQELASYYRGQETVTENHSQTVEKVSTGEKTIEGKKFIQLNVTGTDTDRSPNRYRWNWTKYMLFTRAEGKTYGFILTDSTSFDYTELSEEELQDRRITEGDVKPNPALYRKFIDSVRSTDLG